jgi:hypothetical protein
MHVLSKFVNAPDFVCSCHPMFLWDHVVNHLFALQMHWQGWMLWSLNPLLCQLKTSWQQTMQYQLSGRFVSTNVTALMVLRQVFLHCCKYLYFW